MLKHPSFPEHTDADKLVLVGSRCEGLKSVICEQKIFLSGLHLSYNTTQNVLLRRVLDAHCIVSTTKLY